MIATTERLFHRTSAWHTFGMTDYGHPLEFGVFLPPGAAEFETTLRLARAADALGLELVSVQDHPYNAANLDAWTLLSVIAGCACARCGESGRDQRWAR
jgi:hypothetical protein